MGIIDEWYGDGKVKMRQSIRELRKDAALVKAYDGTKREHEHETKGNEEIRF